jgi:hypothetical protein
MEPSENCHENIFEGDKGNDNEQTYKDNATVYGKCLVSFIRARRRKILWSSPWQK